MKRIFAVAMFSLSIVFFSISCAVQNKFRLRVPDFPMAIRTITPSLVQVRSLVEHNDPSPHTDVLKAGSGFVISKDGFVVTNANIVLDDKNQKLKQIEVLVNRKKYLKARIVGIDMEKDLALIWVDVPKSFGQFKAVHFRKGSPFLGQIVLKAGFPGTFFSESPTFAQGIVTNLRVFLNNLSTPYIATDLQTNEGDSGGPVFDASGAVVGINSKIRNGTGHFVPTDIVLKTLAKLQRGDVPTGWLGINPQNCVDAEILKQDDWLRETATDFLKKENGVELFVPDKGVIIMSVVDSKVGDAVLLRSGDVVLRVNGYIPKDKEEFVQLITEVNPGSKVLLEIVRGGKPMTLQLKVGEFNWFAGVTPAPLPNPTERF